MESAPAPPVPTVSVIIPCFDGEDVVARAIDSALAQTHAPVEVIVVDDGSTDRSLEVIRSYGDRIRHLTGPHCGGGAARNRGLEIAGGELIQFLDADDRLHSDKLRLQVTTWKGEDVVLSRGVVREASGTTRRVGRPTRADFFGVACRDILTVCGPLVRRAALMEVRGFRAELPCCQERDLHLRLAMRGVSWTYVDEELYEVHEQRGSVSSDLRRVAETFPAVYRRAYLELQSAGELTDERARALAEAMVEGASYFVRCGESARARESFALARSMHEGGGLTALGGRHRLASRIVGPVLATRLREWLQKARRSDRSASR